MESSPFFAFGPDYYEQLEFEFAERLQRKPLLASDQTHKDYLNRGGEGDLQSLHMDHRANFEAGNLL